MSGLTSSAASGDTARFLRAWLAEPFAIAAVAPSGQALARIMTARIGPETGPVIELGPGTGVFTQALLARGVPPGQLLLIERSAPFTLLLREKFPELEVVNDLAQRLDRHAEAHLPAQPGAVISGLPLLAMSPSVQFEILAAAFRVLRPGGTLVQFTYGHVPPVGKGVAKDLGLRSEPVGRTFRNVPPASVYALRRIVG